MKKHGWGSVLVFLAGSLKIKIATILLILPSSVQFQFSPI